MTKRRHAPKFLIHATLIAFVHSGLTGAAETNDLEDKLRAIASEAQGKVGVACSLPGTVLKCNLNADTKSPMQSVFKLPLALTVLHQVEQGSLALDDTIHFRPDDRILPHTYSPLQEKIRTRK
jgi:beta-lactamase class A